MENYIEEEVKALATLVKFVKDPKGDLLLALLEHICKTFPADADLVEPENMVSVSCPCQTIHQVTPFGFALLELAETEVGGAGAKPQQILVDFKDFSVEHLEKLASRALRQQQKVANIKIQYMMKVSKKVGQVWLKLIQDCESWKVIGLHISEDMSNHSEVLLKGLAKEAARGSIGVLRISGTCIASSPISALKKLWNITEHYWVAEWVLNGQLWWRACQTWAKMLATIRDFKRQG